MNLCDLARPLLVRSPRSSMKVLGWLGAGYDADARFRKKARRYRTYWDRTLRAYMTADLGEHGGRYAYYWGRFHDRLHQTVIRCYLRPGDTYIDIGANLGYHSVFACRTVGESGLVVSFEPHPDTFRILSAHIHMNRLSQCRLHNLALSDQAGSAMLNQFEEHSGTVSLRTGDAAMRQIPIRCERGDTVLEQQNFPGRAFVKIDVEGFEYQVLCGLEQTLSRIAIAYIEVTPEWLVRQGASAERLFEYMRTFGFSPYLPYLEWKLKVLSPELRLRKLAEPLGHQHDVLFLREPPPDAL